MTEEEKVGTDDERVGPDDETGVDDETGADEEPGYGEETGPNDETRTDEETGRDGPGGDGKSGTFLVTAADEGSAVLSDVADGQVHPLGANPDLEVDEVLEATLAPEGPLGVTWRPVEIVERWTPAIEAVDDPPGERARELADDPGTGRLSQVPIDDGELHVLAVEVGRTESAVEDVLADETTRRIAARLGARHVEVRGEAGVVGVRYLRRP